MVPRTSVQVVEPGSLFEVTSYKGYTFSLCSSCHRHFWRLLFTSTSASTNYTLLYFLFNCSASTYPDYSSDSTLASPNMPSLVRLFMLICSLAMLCSTFVFLPDSASVVTKREITGQTLSSTSPAPKLQTRTTPERATRLNRREKARVAKRGLGKQPSQGLNCGNADDQLYINDLKNVQEQSRAYCAGGGKITGKQSKTWTSGKMRVALCNYSDNQQTCDPQQLVQWLASITCGTQPAPATGR